VKSNTTSTKLKINENTNLETTEAKLKTTLNNPQHILLARNETAENQTSNKSVSVPLKVLSTEYNHKHSLNDTSKDNAYASTTLQSIVDKNGNLKNSHNLTAN